MAYARGCFVFRKAGCRLMEVSIETQPVIRLAVPHGNGLPGDGKKTARMNKQSREVGLVRAGKTV